MFMRKKIAMVLFAAAVALIGVFAFRAFRQNIPDQSPDNSGEMIEQTEEGSSAGADLSMLKRPMLSEICRYRNRTRNLKRFRIKRMPSLKTYLKRIRKRIRK